MQTPPGLLAKRVGRLLRPHVVGLLLLGCAFLIAYFLLDNSTTDTLECPPTIFIAYPPLMVWPCVAVGILWIIWAGTPTFIPRAAAVIATYTAVALCWVCAAVIYMVLSREL